MKYILIFILILLIAGVGFSFTLPSEISISESTKIKSNPKEIEEKILDLKEWESWNEWKIIDSTLNISFGEKDSGVGGRIYWGHKEAKENSILLTNYIPNKLIEFNLVWNSGSDISPGKYEMEFNPKDTTTRLTLTHIRELGNNPIARIMGTMAESIYSEQFKKSLNKLKSLVEKK